MTYDTQERSIKNTKKVTYSWCNNSLSGEMIKFGKYYKRGFTRVGKNPKTQTFTQKTHVGFWMPTLSFTKEEVFQPVKKILKNRQLSLSITCLRFFYSVI